MNDQLDAAARYRYYAEALRGMAETDGLMQTRDKLFRFALDYDKLAAHMEELNAMHSRLKPSSKSFDGSSAVRG